MFWIMWKATKILQHVPHCIILYLFFIIFRYHHLQAYIRRHESQALLEKLEEHMSEVDREKNVETS